MVIVLRDSILKKYCKMAKIVLLLLLLLLLLLFIVYKPTAKTTTFEELNCIEPWLIRSSPGCRGMIISKFIRDP